jgi:hypothetical protein
MRVSLSRSSHVSFFIVLNRLVWGLQRVLLLTRCIVYFEHNWYFSEQCFYVVFCFLRVAGRLGGRNMKTQDLQHYVVFIVCESMIV